MWMNEWDVKDALARAQGREIPNLYRAAVALDRLVDWTNRNSDGWPYWSKPSNASKSLQTTLYDRLLSRKYYEGEPQDITSRELTALLKPVRAFLTRQGVPHGDVLRGV